MHANSHACLVVSYMRAELEYRCHPGREEARVGAQLGKYAAVVVSQLRVVAFLGLLTAC